MNRPSPGAPSSPGSLPTRAWRRESQPVRSLDSIERVEESTVLLETVLQILVRDFRDDLGFEMGRLYRREGQDYFLCCAFEGARAVPIGLEVLRDYPRHVRTLAEGLLIMRKGDPG